MDVVGGRGGARVVVHADAREVVAESRLHRPQRRRIERPARVGSAPSTFAWPGGAADGEAGAGCTGVAGSSFFAGIGSGIVKPGIPFCPRSQDLTISSSCAFSAALSLSERNISCCALSLAVSAAIGSGFLPFLFGPCSLTVIVSPTEVGLSTGPSQVICAETPASFDDSFSSGMSGGCTGSSLCVAASAVTPPASATPAVTRPAGEVAASTTVFTSGSASTFSFTALPCGVSSAASPAFFSASFLFLSSASFFFSSSVFGLAAVSSRCTGVGRGRRDRRERVARDAASARDTRAACSARRSKLAPGFDTGRASAMRGRAPAWPRDTHRSPPPTAPQTAVARSRRPSRASPRLRHTPRNASAAARRERARRPRRREGREPGSRARSGRRARRAPRCAARPTPRSDQLVDHDLDPHREPLPSPSRSAHARPSRTRRGPRAARATGRTGVPSSAAANAADERDRRGSSRPRPCSRASARGRCPSSRRRRREGPPPDLARAAARVRERELDHEAQPAQERAVDVRAQVRGQDREPAVGLHPLQQVGDLEVRVAVVAVLHLAALAEQRVGLVEQQHRAARLGGVEHAGAGSSRSRRCTCSRPPARSIR